MSSEFSGEEDEQLVELVAENPALFDPEVESYKDGNIRDNIWRDIAGKLNKSEEEEEEASSIAMNTEEISNSGWADAMARVLRSRKPKRSRSVVLSRAKKLNEDPKAAEVNGCALKQEVPSSNEHSKGSKLGLQPKCRTKPNILNHDLERKLNRIATKGVVQLFNVVRQQQKNLETQLKEAGASELRRDIVMKSLNKRVFLNVLMGTKHDKIEPQLKKQEEPCPEWKVLHDDFMKGKAKLKDWDKNDNL